MKLKLLYEGFSYGNSEIQFLERKCSLVKVNSGREKKKKSHRNHHGHFEGQINLNYGFYPVHKCKAVFQRVRSSYTRLYSQVQLA